MENCINGAKKLIDEQVQRGRAESIGRFGEYEKSYYWTNEDVNAYLQLADFNNKNNALSVLASGDQAFNLISLGIQNIDTFDINRLTEFYALGLKRAMMLKYNYQDFIKLMLDICDHNLSLEDLTDMIKSLFPYMEKRHQIFWQHILDYNYQLQKNSKVPLNLICMLCQDTDHILGFTIFNHYLQSEENYEAFRTKLANANIAFKSADALNLYQEFNDQYDFILLSNILEYFVVSW